MKLHLALWPGLRRRGLVRSRPCAWCRYGSTLAEASDAAKPSAASLSSASAGKEKPRRAPASLEEALYLAKMAGVFSTVEVQKQIVRGPEFSRDNSPFMLENFLEAEVEEPEINKVEVLQDSFSRLKPKLQLEEFISHEDMIKVLRDEEVQSVWGEVCNVMVKSIEAQPTQFKQSDAWSGTRQHWTSWVKAFYSTFQEGGSKVNEKETWTADSVIHGAIERYFNPKAAPKFWHNNQEWLSRCEGRGTRKRAAAHAVLMRGTGLFRVNGHQDMYHRWPQIYHRIDVCQPFKLTGTAGIYDVFVSVRGGGLSGQAGATRLAVARALFQANPSCHDDLQKGFCLLEDTRQKLSKMAGKPGAQSSHTWNKR